MLATSDDKGLDLAEAGRADSVLSIKNLSTEFRTHDGALRAVDRVSLELGRGRVLAIIGESGSGKSALLRSVLGLHPSSARVTGQILLEGRDLVALKGKDLESVRGRKVAMVFQDSLTALDPVFTVEQQLMAAIRRHLHLDKAQARERALSLLRAVQIPAPEHRMGSYPFELSGGMRQRIVIALALACEPKVLLADEPTTALDVTVQAKVLQLIRSIQQERDLSMIVVTHDLAVAAQVADDIAVMYAGRLVESGPAAEVVASPDHPYTRGLIEANIRPGQKQTPTVIAGSPPHLTRLPPGCAFAPRCPEASVQCWSAPPVPTTTSAGRWASCFSLCPPVAVPVHNHLEGPQA